MTPTILLLVLASAAIHASWNLWAKQIREAARGASIAWLLTAFSTLIYLPPALLLLGAGSWRPSAADLSWIAGSAVLHVIYFLVLLRGYRVGDLSVVYPVARGTGPLLAAAGAIAWFGERATALSVTGALLVATGIVTLTVGPGIARPARVRGGVMLGLCTGLLIASYTLWDGWAVQRIGIPALFYYWAGEVMRIVLYTPLMLRDRGGVVRLWREHRVRVLAIAALSPLSYILMLLALRQGAVSHVAPARELSILFGAWLGGQVLGEGDRTRRIVAAAAFAAGVIALALA
jgi:uncharacterized membrane protein